MYDKEIKTVIETKSAKGYTHVVTTARSHSLPEDRHPYVFEWTAFLMFQDAYALKWSIHHIDKDTYQLNQTNDHRSRDQGVDDLVMFGTLAECLNKTIELSHEYLALPETAYQDTSAHID